jgi:hypothetical protein
MRGNINELIGLIKEQGQNSGELDKNLREEDIYLAVVLNTIQYINHRYKITTKKVTFKKADEDHHIYLTNKILK